MPATTPDPFLFTAPREGASPVIERLAFGTDVQTSRNGTERRTSVRVAPRHIIEFEALLHTDAARASLEALRGGVEILLPLWQHAFERPDTVPSAGLGAGHGLVGLDHAGGVFDVGTGPVAWDDAWSLCAPLARGRFVGDSRSIAHIIRARASAQLSVQLLQHFETVAAYAGPTSGGLPLLDAFTQTCTLPGETIALSSNTHDTGFGDGLFELRHVKQAFSTRLTLRTREQIVAFRQLLFTLRGRLNPLRWTPPLMGESEGTFRLAADETAITYLRPGFATVELQLTRLPA